METWRLEQENKAMSAGKRAEELEADLKVMERNRAEEKVVKETLELEMKSLVEWVSTAEIQMNCLKLEVEETRGLHDEETKTFHERHNAESQLLLENFHR